MMDEATCQSCGAQFDTQEDLARHNGEMHGAEQNQPNNMPESSAPDGGMMKCPMCGMAFNSQEELEQHSRDVHANM